LDNKDKNYAKKINQEKMKDKNKNKEQEKNYG
jgi:hypothetical protein